MSVATRAATRWPRSVRGRLTLWYSAALAAGLVAFAVASLVVLARVLERRSDRFLREARNAFVAELLVESRELPTSAAAIAAALREVRFDETRFAVREAAGRPARADVELHTVGDGEGGVRLATGAVAFDGRWWSVTAEHSRHGLRETVEAVALAYAVSVPLLLAASAAGGYALARRALAPVAAMGRQARVIGATTLHDRLPVANPHDELGELAGVVNALLARLEDAFANQRRFVADASHELRTPVAILLAEAEVTLGRTGRSETEYREAVGVLRDAGHRLSRIVDDLFLLARADAGHQTIRREPLYLDELVADGVRAMQAVAGARGVRLTLVLDAACGDAACGPAPADGAGAEPPSGAPFTGDPALLDRLLLNLLDNAVRYSPPGGVVRVTLAVVRGADPRAAGAYRLRVEDSGPGVPPDAQPHVFERFFRVDRARTRQAVGAVTALADARAVDRPAPSGAGLGLAIARWVAEVHGGTLVLAASSPSGSAFVATLPAPPTPRTSTADPVAAPGSFQHALHP